MWKIADSPHPRTKESVLSHIHCIIGLAPRFYGLAIGFVILAGGHSIGSWPQNDPGAKRFPLICRTRSPRSARMPRRISGAALNPAVSVTLGLGSGKEMQRDAKMF